MEDLREALNALPGPTLTKVDVEQRIREIREKPYGNGYPTKEVEAEALAVFVDEKARGTEFIAILGCLEEWHWGAEERLRKKQEKERREQIAKEKQLAEARLRNGADRPWTAATGLHRVTTRHPVLHHAASLISSRCRRVRLRECWKTGQSNAPPAVRRSRCGSWPLADRCSQSKSGPARHVRPHRYSRLSNSAEYWL
jgi:hypothetical protein